MSYEEDTKREPASSTEEVTKQETSTAEDFTQQEASSFEEFTEQEGSSFMEEAKQLRLQLDQLAHNVDRDPVVMRYPPLFGKLKTNPYRRLRVTVGGLLRRLGLKKQPPWRPALRHAAHTEEANPVLLWALGAEGDELRRACLALKRIEPGLLPSHVPVLVTDIADFAFFSRLGWLVEYVPALSAPAKGYAERKQRYLAWRYRHAPALPVTACLAPDLTAEQVLGLIRSSGLEPVRTFR